MTRSAYIVDDWDEGCFAEFLSDAQVLEYREQGVDVRREPEFDRYAETGQVPDRAWLDAQYQLTCRHCDRIFDAATIETDDGEELPSDPRDVGYVTLCSPSCAVAYREHRERIKSRRAEAADDMRKRAPWATVETWYTGSLGACECRSSDRENQIAQITFDGARVGNNHYCHGCKKFSISRGDKAAWDAAEKTAKGGA